MSVYCMLPERLRVLSVQAERSLRPSGPLLIRGFGVRVPGGAPGGVHVSAVSMFTFGSDIPVRIVARRSLLSVACVLRVLLVTFCDAG